MRIDLLTAKSLRKKGGLGGECMRIRVNNAMERRAKSLGSRAVIIQTLPPMDKWLEIKTVRGTP